MTPKTRHKPNRPDSRNTPLRTSPAADVLEPDLRSAVDLVMGLMKIDGKSGNEGRVAEFVIDKLRAAGAHRKWITTDNAHRRTPIRGECGNLMLKIPGSSVAPRRMLMAHLDTVPICVGCHPVRRGNLIRSANRHTGLGADNRAGSAVVLQAALEILRHGHPHPPLTFLWTVQEETGLHGARLAALGPLGKPKLAFNWDGGAPDKLTIGATGGYRVQIEIFGRASHAGGAPERGISAIAIAALAIADLQRNGWHGDIRKPGGQGTSNVGFIRGGEATNVVTDRVTVRAEARSHNPRFRRRIVREIENAFRVATRNVKDVNGRTGSVTFDGHLDYESFRLAPDEPCIVAAEHAISAIGLSPLHAVTNGGIDANWMVARGIPTVTLGCGQQDQHTVNESLDIPAFQTACRIALRLATASEV